MSLFFLFKQKTAYELRISDWSSDVCSSDLIARRLALDGFIALAPDALTPLGGYPRDEEQARSLFPQLDQARTREDFVAAARFARTLPGGNGQLGVTGFRSDARRVGTGCVSTCSSRRLPSH